MCRSNRSCNMSSENVSNFVCASGNELEHEKFTPIPRIVITLSSSPSSAPRPPSLLPRISSTYRPVQSLVHVECIELLQHQSRLRGHVCRMVDDTAQEDHIDEVHDEGGEVVEHGEQPEDALPHVSYVPEIRLNDKVTPVIDERQQQQWLVQTLNLARQSPQFRV